jgi:hypothetical protein
MKSPSWRKEEQRVAIRRFLGQIFQKSTLLCNKWVLSKTYQGILITEDFV